MGDLGLIPGLGGYPLQYFGLENSMDCIVHGVTKRHDWVTFTFTLVWCQGQRRSGRHHVRSRYQAALALCLEQRFWPWPVPTPIANRLRLDSGPLTLPESPTQSWWSLRGLDTGSVLDPPPQDTGQRNLHFHQYKVLVFWATWALGGKEHCCC